MNTPKSTTPRPGTQNDRQRAQVAALRGNRPAPKFIGSDLALKLTAAQQVEFATVCIGGSA